MAVLHHILAGSLNLYSILYDPKHGPDIIISGCDLTSTHSRF